VTKTPEITELLQAWNRGDDGALERLMPLVDRELRRLAHSYMSGERVGHTLQTTALINEALIRFIEADNITWDSRSHFYSIVAKRMRQILVEHARTQLAAKRGKRPERVDTSVALRLSTEQSEELLVLDAALNKLAEVDERKAKVVEYRYFGGFTESEVAEMLDVSLGTVEREWRLARSWLRRETMDSGGQIQPPSLSKET
jgi:RNA polymerase sigma-70 factor, ECF subfamily